MMLTFHTFAYKSDYWKSVDNITLVTFRFDTFAYKSDYWKSVDTYKSDYWKSVDFQI